jgi:hypothetical protein
MTAAHISANVFSLQNSLSNIHVLFLTIHSTSFISIIHQLLPDRRGGRPESSLSLRSHGGGTPPLLAPGRVTPPRHILGVRLVLLWGRCHGKRVVFTIRERASTPSFTHEVPVAGALSAAAFASGVGGMDFGAWR